MSRKPRLPALHLLAVGLVTCVAPRLSAQEFVRDRLIVKFAPAISEDVQTTLSEGRSFRAQAPDTQLDALMRKYRIRAARRLFARGQRTYKDARAFLESRAERARQRLHGARTATRPLPDLANVFVLELPPGSDVMQAAKEFSRDPSVIYAEPSYIGHAAFLPDDPFVSCRCCGCQCQWPLHRIRAPEAWDRSHGEGIVVAVLDSGINREHRDIKDNVWSNDQEIVDGVDNDGNGFVDDLWGWDFVSCNAYSNGLSGNCIDRRPDGDNDPSDESLVYENYQYGGHGTAVSGIVSAQANNGLDIAGVAFGARVMGLRVSFAGDWVAEDLPPAIVYAANNGARIINMSLAMYNDSRVIGDAIRYASALDVLMIVAAGNDALYGNPPNALAAFEEVISVGATRDDDAGAAFSTYNDKVELSAPGDDLLTLLGLDEDGPVTAGVKLTSGTSAAAPHVAALAALLYAWKPSLAANEVRELLCAGTVDLGMPGRDPFFGCGRIDAAKTLQTVCAADVCGDGVHEASCDEECDDGNTVDGDCCSGVCDQSFCSPCDAIPRRDCGTGKARLLMKHRGSEARDLVAWNWAISTEPILAMPDPTAGGDRYAFCVYDSGGLRLEARATAGACAGGPCWGVLPTGYYRYSDKLRTPDGLATIVLKGVKVLLKGKGEKLSLPALPLNELPVTVQLQASNGECWEAVYSTAIKNDATQFKAKAD